MTGSLRRSTLAFGEIDVMNSPLEQSAKVDDQLLVMAVYFLRSQAWKFYVELGIPVVIEDVERKRRLFATVIASSKDHPLVLATTDAGGFELCSELAKPEGGQQSNPDIRDIPNTLRIAYDLSENLESVDRSRLKAHNIKLEKFPGLPFPSFRNCERGCSPWPTNSEENLSLLVVLKGLLGLFSVARDFCSSPRVRAREDAVVARVLNQLAPEDRPSEPCLLLEAERIAVLEPPKKGRSKKGKKAPSEVESVSLMTEIPEEADGAVSDKIAWGFAPTITPASNLQVDPEFIEVGSREIALVGHPELKADTSWEAMTFLNEIAVSEGGKPYYPRLPILCDGKTGQMLPAEPTHPSVSTSRAIWLAFLHAVQETGRRPKTLCVSRLVEFETLDPVFKMLGINLKLVKRLKQAGAAAIVLAQRMSAEADPTSAVKKTEYYH